jgi:urease accessory protein
MEALNALFLASRETAELRAETVQMGYSLNRLLPSLGIDAISFDEPAFPAAFAAAVNAWQIDPHEALQAYLWSWLENQVMAAVKTVPLGQTDGQRMLLSLANRIPDVVNGAIALRDDDVGSFAPGFAMLSSKHETQYSRLFRS